MLSRLKEHWDETNSAIPNIQDSTQQMADSLSTSQQTPPTRTTTPSPAPTTATAIESLKADIIKELAPQLIGALKEIIGASVQSAVSDAISQKLYPQQQLRPTIEQILQDILPTRVTPASYPGPSPAKMLHMNHPMYSMPAHLPLRYNHSPHMLPAQHSMTHSPQCAPNQSPNGKKARPTSPMDDSPANPCLAQRFGVSDDAPGENPSNQQ
jgi:hypothetical protein